MLRTATTIAFICVLMAFLWIISILASKYGYFNQKQPTDHRSGAVERLWREHGVISYDACQQFAFNDVKDPESFNPFEAYRTWNRLHGDIFIIYPTDMIGLSYIRIGEECFRRGL